MPKIENKNRYELLEYEISRRDQVCVEKTPGRDCLGPTCKSVVETLEICMNRKNHHFIVAIDASRSITNKDYDNLKKTLERMFY